MNDTIEQFRIMIASPGDVQQERAAAVRTIQRLNSNIAPVFGLNLRSFTWETDIYPSFHASGTQGLIDEIADITDLDVLVGIFWKRFGTPMESGETGTEHEFNTALAAWRENQRPQIMTYFSLKEFPNTLEIDFDQAKRVQDFRKNFPQEGIYRCYNDLNSFTELLHDDLCKLFRQESKKVRHRKPSTDTADAIEEEEEERFNIKDIGPLESNKLKLPFSWNAYSSFVPKNDGATFYRIHAKTTDGVLDKFNTSAASKNTPATRIENSVYIVRDPIRPFEIQIGESRAQRPGGDPGTMPLLDELTLDVIKQMYPFIVEPNKKWLRMSFAELSTDPDVLDFINKEDPEDEVKIIASKNPSASDSLKKKECLFCNDEFLSNRNARVSKSGLTKIFNNDFPYGPCFHFIAMPSESVHGWEDVTESQIGDMNLEIRDYVRSLKNDGKLNGAAGVRIGLNSSIRHLVMGKTTRTSAGASIPHVHKQIWGLAPNSLNLSDHLYAICKFYEDKGIDYLGRYLTFLKHKRLVLWEDDHAALYVPLGQIAIHELQVIIKRSGCGNILALTDAEVRSVSRAEYIVTKIFASLGINSFNLVTISQRFDDEDGHDFRIIFTYITREVDIAVSELNLLYVVDKHPVDTRNEVSQFIGGILAVLDES